MSNLILKGFSKIKFYLYLATLFLIISCTDSEKGNQGRSDTSTSKSIPDSSTSNNSLSNDTAKKQSVKQTGDCHFSDLTYSYSSLKTLASLSGFRRFVFIPYRRKDGDEVRLFAYAAKTNGAVLGRTFAISTDGTGENPSTLPAGGHTIYDTLQLKKDTLAKFPAGSFRNIVLKPEDTIAPEDGKTYCSYRIFLDATDTKFVLNPSPPAPPLIIRNK